ncbi:MAG: CGNR zinc finger domain-containing protein [Spirochaetales bacterium]|nr:CGNR zinc finger domain-containing protein [Spirochaetales bacterium]
MLDVENGIKKFKSFALDGNNIALDFVNTVEYRGTKKEIEWIESYLDALCWAERSSILAKEDVIRLFEANNDECQKFYEDIIVCRKTLHDVFSAVIEDGMLNKLGLDLFNKLYKLVHRVLTEGAGGNNYVWLFPDAQTTAVGFLQPVIQASADLLLSSNLSRLKRCSNAECGWLYYDTSKNNSRRWCCMSSCGNRAKASNFYKRHNKK